MFKPGDKVVCIRYDKIYIELLESIFHIDEGKIYEISNVNGDEICLVGKQSVVYHANNFISLKEYRKRKISCLNQVTK